MSLVSDSKMITGQNNEDHLKNIISIENFDGNNGNLRQKKPKKGKLYLGSNFNAYNRENLGSIPRRTENVLIRDKNNPVKLGFLSNTGRFESKAQNVKYNYPGPGTYVNQKELDTTANSLNTTSRSSKGFGNGFISKTSRFDDLKEYYDKYLPCPTQYKRDRVLSMDASIQNSTFLQSLYNKTETKSLKPILVHPGPGFYNPKKNEPVFDEGKKTFYFKSESERFGKGGEDDRVGPGSYFNHEDDLNKILSKPSYYFYEAEKRQDPLIEKYLNVKKTYVRYAVPGPGAYKPETFTNIENKYVGEQEPSVNKHKRSISTSDGTRNKTKVSVCKQDFYEQKSAFENFDKAISSPFLSKTTHDTDFNKRVKNPGPAYYTPNLIPDKLSFNCNVEKKFI